MCSTALPPPPPTPITLICVPMLNSSIISIAIVSSNSVCSCHCVECWKYVLDVIAAPSPRQPLGGGSRACVVGDDRLVVKGFMAVLRSCRGTSPWRGRTSVLTEPACCAARWPRVRAMRASSSRPITVAERGLATMSCKRAAVGRRALPHGLEEDVLAELDHSGHHRRAAGDDDAAREQLLVAALADHLVDQRIDLLDARLDHAGQRLALEHARRPVAEAGHLELLVRVGEQLLGDAVLDLDLLGVLGRRAQRHRDVARDQVAGDRDHRGVADRAVGEDRDVGRAGADVDQRDAEVLLVVGQHRVARRARVQHQLLDFQPAAAHALDDVLGRALRAGDDVHA